MSNQYLKLRRSSVPGKIPDTASLDFGEIALNTYDGLAYMKVSASFGEKIISIGVTSGSFTGSLFGTASWAQNAITSSYPIAVTGSTLYSFNAGVPIGNSTLNSIFFGEYAGDIVINAYNSNFLGSYAGGRAINASYSNFLGANAGFSASEANNSNFFGYTAGYIATNAYNSNFFGNYAGYVATNANNSNFFGNSTGLGGVNANNSNFFGNYAGVSATNAFNSNFLGYLTGRDATNASNSNFFGSQAGERATSASYSTLIGFQAGFNIAGGALGIRSNNIIIGTNITLPNGRQDSINLGAIIFATGSYSTTSGNPFSGSANGRVGINQPTPIFNLDVSGSGRYTTGLTVTGSLVAPSITGSLQGTSSWAQNAVTASYALNAGTGNVSGSEYYVAVFSGSSSVGTGSIFDSGSFTAIGATATPHLDAPERLFVDASDTESYNLISGHGTINNYLQLNIKNFSSGATGSSDVVATADNGDETSFFIDMGVNSSGYNVQDGIGQSNDAYLYSTAQDLLIGNASAGKRVIIFNGSGPALDNARVYITPEGTVGINASDTSLANPEALLVEPLISGAAAPTDFNNLIIGRGTINESYLQLNMINKGTGSYASTDVVATNDIGTETSNYIDMGINSSNHIVDTTFAPGGANDSYLLSTANDLLIGSSTSGNVILWTGPDFDDKANAKLSLRPTNQHSLTGSLLATQGFTGSLFGTASWSQNSLTASYFLTSSVTSASYALTASAASNFVVGNSLTASNALITGTITAQTLVVQTITASVEYSSGSNIFGSQLTDTQQFTGSVSITGSLTVNGNSVVTSNQTGSMSVATASFASTASYFFTSSVTNATSASLALTASYFFTSSVTNATSASFIPTSSLVGNFFAQGGNSFGTTALLGTNDNQPLAFETSGSTRMFISGSGNVGIGTINPIAKLQVDNSVVGDSLKINGATNTSLTFNTDTFGRASINVFGNTSATVNAGAYFSAYGYEEAWFNVVSNQGSSGNKYWRFGNLGISNYFAIQKLNDTGTAIAATPLTIFSSTGNVLLQGLGTSTTDSGERFQVSGSSRFAGNMVISGSGNTSGTNGLLIQNSSAVSTFIARNDGRILNGDSTFYVDRYTVGGTTMVLSVNGHNGATGIEVTNAVGIRAYSNLGVSVNNALGASIYAAGGNTNAPTNISLGLLSNRALITSTASGMNMHTSSMLQVDSTSQGFLPPRMTAAQRLAITTPARGLLVYDIDSATEGLWFYNSGSISGWQEVLTNSGSQSISGSLIVTQGITSSLFGTSSWAVNFLTSSVTSASFASTASYFFTSSVTSASFASTASYFFTSSVTNATSASFASTASYFFTSSVTNATSASLASTASYFFTSSVTNATSASYAQTASAASNFIVGNSLTASNALITGTITAQTLIVQTITASVEYSSGSNIFGSQLSNTQQFTGSVSITGSLSVNNSSVILSNQTGSMSVATASFASSSISASYAATASFIPTSSLVGNFFAQGGNSFGTTALLGTNDSQDLAIETSGSTRIFISGSGNVGIGTTSILTTAAGYRALAINGTVGGVLEFQSNGTRVATINNNSTQLDIETKIAGPITFGINSSEKVRIDTSGSVGIGTAIPSSSLHIKGVTTSALSSSLLVENSTGQGYLKVGDSGIVSIGKIADGEIQITAGNFRSFIKSNGGKIEFQDYLTRAGSINSIGLILTSGSDPYPTNRLDVVGNIFIGSTISVASASLHISGSTTGSEYSLLIQNSSGQTLISAQNDRTVNINATNGANGGTSIGTTNGVINFNQGYNNTLIGNALSFYSGGPASTIQGFFTNPGIAIGYAQTNTNPNPGTELAIRGTSVTSGSAVLFVTGSSATRLLALASETNPNAFVVSGSGNVGIGTANPLYRLDVNGQSYVANLAIFNQDIQVNRDIYAAQIFSRAANNTLIHLNSTTDMQFGLHNASMPFRWYVTSGNEIMRLFGSGNLLIQNGGTFTNNGYRLQVNGTGTTSGSLWVSGSSVISGSLTVTEGITGSLFGTSSWAQNSISSSYAGTASVLLGSVVSASYAATASWALNFITSSVTSASFAITSSFPLRGLITASVVASTLTFTKGDGTTFDLTVAQSGTVATASYITSSGVFGPNGADSILSSSFASTASYFLTSSVTSASFASTASYFFTSSVTSASFASTASYFFTSSVTNATSASLASTASYFFTSSVTNATSASYAQTASAASNFVVGNSLTASNALITGTITAQTLVVQTITASVSEITGSTQFGSLLTNTHEFTGSVSMTGSLSVGGNISNRGSINSTSVTGTGSISLTPSSNSTITLTGFYNTGQTNMSISPGGSDYFIDTYGAGNRLIIRNNSGISLTAYSSATQYMHMGSSGVRIGGNDQTVSARLHVSGSDSSLFLINSSTAGSVFYVSGSGNVGIGTTIPAYKLTVTGSGTVAAFVGIPTAPTSIQVGGGELGTLFIESQTNGGSDGINMYTQRGNTSFNIGYRTTSGANGSAMNIGNLSSYAAGNINFLQNGTTKVIIDTSGSVGIGTTTPNAKLDISGSAIITGSLTVGQGITGSLFGTASWAQNAISSSYAGTASVLLGSVVSSSYAATASWALNFLTSSVTSASFASTASYFFTSSVTSASFASTASYGNNGFIIGASQFNNTSSVTVAGTTIISQLATGSYTSCFYNYTIASASNARSGQVMSVWNGSTVRYAEVTTMDIGNTATASFAVALSGNNVQLNFTAPGAWTVKNISNLL